MKVKRDEHLVETDNALVFLERLDADAALAERCERTDLEGRLRIASEIGLPVSEAEFRRAIRSWDYHGRWTRWQSAGRLAEAFDDLPELDGEYPVSDEAVASYRRDGHLLLRQVVGPQEVEAYRPVVRDLVARHNTQVDARDQRPEERGYLQVVNLHMRSAAARRLVRSPRLGRIAARLLGVEAVRIYIDQAFYKEPGGKMSHWHQDQLYYPLETERLVTMWLPLVDVSHEMGVVAYASGSHREGFLGFKPDRADAEEDHPRFVRRLGYPIWKPGQVMAGDATYHHGWVVHGAYANRSDRMREVVVVIYYPDGTRIVEPSNEFQKRAIRYMWGEAAKPGELAAGPTNPVVYSAG
ncbi:MAG: phytanoyl-CoA dioxygenase family protein [Thermoanaerobaculia bacterium]|nr:phytanoyl-CoA dioxygenase family protein [Thermoanaerobaculia bacterium]